MKVKYTHNGYSINLLSPLRLYVNGTWLKVKPIWYYKDTLVVENVDTRLRGITIATVDLLWHFTTADAKQIRADKGKLSLRDKLSFVLRSKELP
jgi:hypothetical protein